MPRLDRPLTKDEVAKLSRTVGSHAVGGSLYLLVRGAGRCWWVHRFYDAEKRRYSSQGFGSYPETTLTQARKKREDSNVARRNGTTEAPRNRATVPAGKTFKECASDYLDHNSSLWTAASFDRNKALLKNAASLNDVPVGQITTAMIADVLRPVWSGPTNNRGSKLRSLIERVLTGNTDPNPATWDLLKHANHKLALKSPETQSHPAMPAAEIPAFAKRLDMSKAADRCILFVILCGVRRREATGATWAEFDLRNKRWMIPGSRTKTGKDHFVPLSDAAIKCLGEPGAPGDFVFPNIQGHDALRLSKRFGVPFDLHGFRSSLSSWAEDKGFKTNVVQAVLAHRKKDDNGKALGSQDTAYMRSTLFDERRKLHDAWATFVKGA